MITSTPPINSFRKPGEQRKPAFSFCSSSEVYDWLSAFTNVERGQNIRSFRLDRMNALADLAGRPEKCAPAIHVAGSKGKGSVTGMIAAILEASGIMTACYASPHVCDFRERISLGSKFFDEEAYVTAGNELWELVEKLPFSPGGQLFSSHPEDGEAPSFFELMTLWFFLCTRCTRSGAMAVETGLGGRLDATNILDPAASVITLIELEHTEYLGNTIAAIAEEKAGIIKPGRPVVLARQREEALEVFREHAARKGSQLIYFPDCAELSNISVKREGTSFNLDMGKKSYPNLFIPMPGEVQAYNAGLAVLAVKTAYPALDDESVKAGLEKFSLPARFEKICDKPPVIIDGAHTKESTALCLETFSALYGPGAVLVFGCATGKDVFSMAKLCVPLFSFIIITRPGTFKKSDPDMVFAAFNAEAGKTNNKPEIIFIPDTEAAVNRAVSLALERGLPVLGTGSFYLAGIIRDKFLPHNGAGK